MISEGWTLNDAMTYAEGHSLNLTVYDSTGVSIPRTEYKKYSSIKLLSQSKAAGTEVITGSILSVKIDTIYITSIPENQDIS